MLEQLGSRYTASCQSDGWESPGGAKQALAQQGERAAAQLAAPAPPICAATTDSSAGLMPMEGSAP